MKCLDVRKIGFSTTKSQCRRPNRDSVKRWFLIVVNIVAISASVLALYSCKFFSYKELDVFNDEYTSEADLSYEPFEYLPRAGVGLFSYYMGDPTGKGVVMNDQMCFSYSDEFTDYQWLSSNNKETGGVDKWVLARYCSILAPIFGLLAFLQIVVETISGSRMMYCGNGIILKTQLLLCAAFFQIGTFSVVLAPPIMYSTSVEDQQQQFCFSEASNVRCKMDTGSMFSLASTIIYLILAHTCFYTRRPSIQTNDAKSAIERDTDDSSISDISESNSESHSENHSKNSLSLNQSQSVSASEDEASVFSTLIQYFGRNHMGEEVQEETLVESDLDIRIGQSILESIDELGHNSRTGENHNAADTITDSRVSSLTSETPKKKKWGRMVANFNHARSTDGNSKSRRTRKTASKDEHSKTNDRDKEKSSNWETESANSLLELGIKLQPMTPYSASRSYTSSYTSEYNQQNRYDVEDENINVTGTFDDTIGGINSF